MPISDIWKTALPILGKIAPTLATAVGGPFAGVAVGAIENVFGLAKDGDPVAAAAAVAAATPDQLLALKKADADFQESMRALDISEEKLGFDDTASARAMNVAVNDHTPAVLSYLLTVGFFGLLLVAAFHGFPVENAALLNIMIGSLGTAWGLAMAFNFGSSHDSGEKTRMIYNSAPVTK